MAVSRKRDKNDAGIDPSGLLRRETELGECLRAIALRKDIGLSEQILQLIPAFFLLEVDKRRELAAAGIDREPGDRWKIGARHQQHVGAMRGQRATGDGARDHARQVEYAQAG